MRDCLLSEAEMLVANCTDEDTVWAAAALRLEDPRSLKEAYERRNDLMHAATSVCGDVVRNATFN